jgi:hypothetical protein
MCGHLDGNLDASEYSFKEMYCEGNVTGTELCKMFQERQCAYNLTLRCVRKSLSPRKSSITYLSVCACIHVDTRPRGPIVTNVFLSYSRAKVDLHFQNISNFFHQTALAAEFPIQNTQISLHGFLFYLLNWSKNDMKVFL